ncbi:MFS general substrate transporter [Eremomyces bilateralis CBS 781.70]|uniref:MFS general substrate transporter n=1 Tax=Eremomyces bilateralis CBS 781.70 TaxID=1392243 RepID=A0A6G1FWC3_9PEZI|nr:MFS general substrate transporter [Eremomyces bilateralis CBS 781.70]KAF1809981.1 MFS general substrate transporter [Eremomyces bilateralis CBS 781.70]
MDTQEGLRPAAAGRSSIDSDSTDISELVIEEPPESHGGFPPRDGIEAWKFLLGCSIVEAFIWAFALSFGIFEAYFGTHPAYQSSSYISTIGTLSVGLSYLGLPPINALALRYPHRQRQLMILGWLLTLFSLLCASQATKVWHLVLWQGFALGLGWVVCYAPFLIMLNGWFDKRRGLAYGIVFGASGLSGMIIPFLLEKGLREHGYEVTLQYFVLATIIVTGPALLLIKPRVTSQKRELQQDDTSPFLGRPHRKPQDINTDNSYYGFLHSVPALLFMLSVLLQGLAGFLPDIFIPSYSAAISPPGNYGDLLLALRSLFQTVGQIGIGYASDVFHPLLPPFIDVAVSTVSVIGIWGPAKSTPVLALFASIWGAFAGGYSVVWFRAVALLAESRISSAERSRPEGCSPQTVTMYGWCSFLRGVAMIVGGYIGANLLGKESDVDLEKFGLGRWDWVVRFCAIALFASTICGGLCWKWDIVARRRRANRSAHTLDDR